MIFARFLADKGANVIPCVSAGVLVPVVSPAVVRTLLHVYIKPILPALISNLTCTITLDNPHKQIPPLESRLKAYFVSEKLSQLLSPQVAPPSSGPDQSESRTRVLLLKGRGQTPPLDLKMFDFCPRALMQPLKTFTQL